MIYLVILAQIYQAWQTIICMLVTFYAFVNVDEIGTEAAAITSIFGTRISSHTYYDPVTFRADHPFIFAIWDDETNVILFMGKMSDPTV